MVFELASFLLDNSLNILLGLLGILVSIAIWAYPRLQKKQVSYALDAGGWIDPVMQEVSVTYKDQKLENPHFAKFRLQNTGRTHIDRPDFVDGNHIRFSLRACHAPKNRKVLGVFVEEEEFRRYVTVDSEGRIAVAPCVMNSRDRVSITAILDGCYNRESFDVAGRILGGKLVRAAENPFVRTLLWTGLVLFICGITIAVFGNQIVAAWALILSFYLMIGSMISWREHQVKRRRRLGLTGKSSKTAPDNQHR